MENSVMIPITSDQVTLTILSLFDFSKPTMPRAFNVLEGVNRGQILVDDLSYPTWVIVREAIYGTLYLGGQVDSFLLELLVERFRQTGDVGIGCWLDDPLSEMLPSNPDYDGRTLYFTERSDSREGKSIPLPEGYGMVTRDRQYLKQSPDYESMLQAFGTEANILEHTLGVIIVHDGKVVCEAATGAPTHGRMEIGVTTTESHRQQGLATTACARLIELCEARGYKTWWDCAKQNLPSVKLARKLGYCNEREYHYTWWARKNIARS